jgi:hypothetical protein
MSHWFKHRLNRSLQNHGELTTTAWYGTVVYEDECKKGTIVTYLATMETCYSSMVYLTFKNRASYI